MEGIPDRLNAAALRDGYKWTTRVTPQISAAVETSPRIQREAIEARRIAVHQGDADLVRWFPTFGCYHADITVNLLCR